MNIAMIPTINHKGGFIQNGQRHTASSEQSFGSVFGQLLSTQQENTATPFQSMDSLLQLLQATTMEEFEQQLAALEHISYKREEWIEQLELSLQQLDLLGKDEHLPQDPLQLLMVLHDELPLVAKHLQSTVNTNPQLEAAIAWTLTIKQLLLASQQYDQSMLHEQGVENVSAFLQTMTDMIESKVQPQPKTVQFAPVTIRISVDSQASFGAMHQDSPKQGTEASGMSALQPVTDASAIRNGFSIQASGSTEMKSETFLREIQQIFKRANFGMVGGSNRLLIKLYPEHLGQIRIELIETNGVLTARMLASTALGKELLDSQMNQLRQAFLQQNLQIDRIEVGQALQDTSKNDRESPFQQQSKGQQQTSKEQLPEDNPEELTFEEYLIELEV